MRKEITCYGYILNVLNKNDFSRKDLYLKAINKGYLEPDVIEALDKLKLQGYQNDSRLAENIVYFYSKTRGVNWIKQKLNQKNLERDVIRTALETYSNVDNSELERKVRSKYNIKDFTLMDQKQYTKLYSFLIYSGYDNVSQIIESFVSIDRNIK